MNRESFLRKVGYVALIVMLLFPLAWLSLPSTARSPGGVLARKRIEYKLGQASLGEIDPASEALKLSMLGLRSIAGLILWNQADEYRMKEDWTSYRATLDQLVNLQPYYVGPWLSQAHNLSFNIASEFDDYHDRYYWAIEGLKFLQRGTAYNEHEPRLLERIGWFACNKFGKADERLQFRKLFHDDDDFHKLQTVHQRDNWLFGREYYLLAERVVDNFGAIPPQEPVIFHNWPNIARGYAAEALDDDHLRELLAAAARVGSSTGPGQAARADSEVMEDVRFAQLDADYRRRTADAWKTAEADWKEYGKREFTGPTGLPFRLGDDDLARAERSSHEMALELEALAPGMGDTIAAEKRAILPAEQKDALNAAPSVRSKEQQGLARLAEDAMRVSFHEIAERAPADARVKAMKVADEATATQTTLIEIRHGREEIGYAKWLRRCQAEKSDDAREARRVHHAQVYFHVDADCQRARRRLEAAFASWRRLLDAFPELKDVSDAAFVMVDAVQLYWAVLRQLDEPFPKKFILQDLLDAQRYDRPEVLP